MFCYQFDTNVTANLWTKSSIATALKMKFSIKDFSSKCDQIRSFPRIWSYLLQKSLENFISCVVRRRVFL